MGTACTRSIVSAGLDGQPVEVSAETSEGLAGLVLSGLPDGTLRETRDRIRAAIINSGESWPDSHLTVTVTPAVRRQISGLDLAIAVVVLAAAGSVPCPPDRVVFLGELGLDGGLRPVRGVLPALTAAAAAGVTVGVVPEGNAAEAALVSGVRVTGATDLAAVLHQLRTGGPVAPLHAVLASPAAARRLDLAGQLSTKLAAETCAAGGHHLLLSGPPGAGATLLAERIPGLMPPLDQAAALEVTATHSLAGLLPSDGALVSEPPLASPHHTASTAAVLGGGTGLTRPGAASLAHHGVLFLDEAPEFGREVLDALRQPLEHGHVVLARSRQQARFPADFTLVLAARPCPCASLAGLACTCPPTVRHRYRARLAGLLPRIDLTVRLRLPGQAPNVLDRREPSRLVAARVADARQRAARRLAGTPWRLNARIPGGELRRRFPPTPRAQSVFDRAVELGEISHFDAGRVLAVAWTLADLTGAAQPGGTEATQALALRLGPQA